MLRQHYHDGVGSCVFGACKGRSRTSSEGDPGICVARAGVLVVPPSFQSSSIPWFAWTARSSYPPPSRHHETCLPSIRPYLNPFPRS